MILKRNYILFLIVLGLSLPMYAYSKNPDTAEVYDVSTPDQSKGSKGRHGSSGGGDGGKGRDGADAADAGSIDVTLIAVESEDGVFKMDVVGKKVEPKVRGGQTVRIEDALPINQKILLDAHGGDGGSGGDGGDGGKGSTGSSGSNATRYSSATRGGTGGRGGDSGGRGNGGDAGAGGDTIVRVSDRNMDTLMNVDHKNKAGKPGEIGRHGSVGQGGDGGRGGSGTSWTTQERESYTDSQGKRKTRTVTKHHSRPSASNGSRGSSGSHPSDSPSSGRTAPNGKHQYIVTYADGKEKIYNTRFNIDVLSFTSYSENGDTIYEPGEKIIVRDIKIQNIGGMHTPMHQEVRIFINGNEWVLPDGKKLTVPKVLEPGEVFEFKDTLEFIIKNITVTEKLPKGGSFKAESDILLLADVSRVGRIFEDRTSSPFVIQFPIEMSPITGLHSLMPGEGTKLSWKVKNISSRHFGEDSELKRAIETLIKVENSEIAPENISYQDSNGQAFSMDNGHLSKLLTLGPGEETTINAKTYLDKGIPAYHNTRFRNALQLGKIDEPETTRTIQYEEHNINSATEYKHEKGSKFLLVTNNRTTNEVIEEWREIAATYGKQLEIWDLSYHGHLDLSQNFKDNPHILDDFAGNVMIVANNVFDPSPQVEAKATDFLTRKDLLLAGGKYGVNIYVAGESFHELADLLTPVTTDRDRAKVLDARQDFYRSVERLQREFPDLAFATVQAKDLEHSWEIDVSFRKRFSRPKGDDLNKLAQELKERSLELFTPEEHRVDLRFDESLSKANEHFADRWKLGSILIDSRLTDNVVRYDDIDSYLERMEKLRAEFPEFTIDPSGVDSSGYIWEIDVKVKWDVWKKPTEEKLKQIGEKLNQRLQILFPERNLRVIHDFQPELLKHVPFLSKTHDLGSLRIRQSNNGNTDNVVHLPADSNKMHSRKFVNSAANLTAFHKTLDPKTKIEFLRTLAFSDKKLSSKEIEYLKYLGAGLLSDIAREQNTARTDPQWSKKSAHQKMPILKALSEIAEDPVLARNFSSVQAESEPGKIIAELVADINFFLESQVKWYEHLWPAANNVDSTRASKALVTKFQQAAFARLGLAGLDDTKLEAGSKALLDDKENLKYAQTLIKDLTRSRHEEHKEIRKQSEIDKREQGHRFAQHAMNKYGITTDTQTQPQGADRNISQADYIDQAMKGLDRAANIDNKVNRAVADRCTLLLGAATNTRITYKGTGDRHYDGKQVKTTSRPTEKTRNADPEIRLWNPKFQAPTKAKASVSE